MSVLRSRRTVSRYEYEHIFINLYRYSQRCLSKIPKRRKKWLCPNIELAMNDSFMYITEISDGYFKRSERSEKIAELVNQSIRSLSDLQKPLFILWNIEKYSFTQMAQWANEINQVMKLLSFIKHEDVNKLPIIQILDWNKIHEVAFLENMSLLHRFVHGKAIHIKNSLDGTDTACVVQLVDDAFYQLILANQKIPETKEQYKIRRERISEAISDLKKMNRPLISIFNIMEYSNNVMKEWADILNLELKLLYGLQKSDQERFKNLV